jgi:hypothetical protein
MQQFDGHFSVARVADQGRCARLSVVAGAVKRQDETRASCDVYVVAAPSHIAAALVPPRGRRRPGSQPVARPRSLSSVRVSVSNTISTGIAGGYGTSCDRRVGWFQVRIGSWLVRRMVGGPSPPGDDGLSVGDPAQRDELPEGPMRGLPSAFGWRWSSRASRPPLSSVRWCYQYQPLQAAGHQPVDEREPDRVDVTPRADPDPSAPAVAQRATVGALRPGREERRCYLRSM